MPDFTAKDATHATRARNHAAAGHVPRSDDDFANAARGLVAQHPTGRIEGPFGPARDVSDHDFIEIGSPAPDTVHPSLWRHAQLNAQHGLFQVDDGLWQVRGYDLSNITFIAGDTGWVIIDPLTTTATAAAALALANHHLGERPVRTVIYTHSHVDHYGGVLGVTSADAVAAGEVEIVAPVGFMDEVISEFVLAGDAMSQRSSYQFGIELPPGLRSHVDAGLGTSAARSPSGLLAPTLSIERTGEEHVFDGVRIVFQNTPDAEAPAEMNFYFPDRKWLCTAENCTHTMHNLIPFRGAQARNTLAWSKYIGEALALWGDEVEVSFASHHWPRWGNADIVDYLERQRDLYRFVHDQTLRLANRGLVASEIAEVLALPDDFAGHGDSRGYYGSLVHNVKAVYQFYLSWYDANPAHLWPHPPVEAAKRYVEFMGGTDATLDKARRSFARGDYRWVAEVVNHVVFASPDNLDARALQADALEQLGYQSESATWRNAYLSAAAELRRGHATPRTRRPGQLAAANLEQLTDFLAVRLNADSVGGQRWTVNFDLDRATGTLGLANRALHLVPGSLAGAAHATVTGEFAALAAIAENQVTLDETLAAGTLRVSGDAAVVHSLFAAIDPPNRGFDIVLP